MHYLIEASFIPAEMVLERYVSPDGKYAVEIIGQGGAFARSRLYVGLASSKDRQLLMDGFLLASM